MDSFDFFLVGSYDELVNTVEKKKEEEDIFNISISKIISKDAKETGSYLLHCNIFR